MSGGLDRVISYVLQTLERLPDETCEAFDLSPLAFRHAGAGGGRLDLEEMVGESRVFEIELEDIDLAPIMMGNGSPLSYTARFPVVFRYEGAGPHDRAATLRRIANDLRAAVDAVHRGSWSSVLGCVAMRATPGSISKFTLSDDAGHTYEGYSSEVLILCSFDD